MPQERQEKADQQYQWEAKLQLIPGLLENTQFVWVPGISYRQIRLKDTDDTENDNFRNREAFRKLIYSMVEDVDFSQPIPDFELELDAIRLRASNIIVSHFGLKPEDFGGKILCSDVKQYVNEAKSHRLHKFAEIEKRVGEILSTKESLRKKLAQILKAFSV